MSSAVYSYPFFGFVVTARVAEALEIEVNRRSWRVPLDALRFIYVTSSARQEQLVVAYDGPDGKRGVLRSSADAGAAQFKALVDHLAALKPAADLRGRSRREAFKIMGARDIERVARVVVPVLITLLVFGLMIPYLVQGFDEGLLRVSAAQLQTVELTTSNIMLSGTLLPEQYVHFGTAAPPAEENDLWARCRDAVLARKRKFTAYYLFPIRPAGAGADAPVPVVLQVPDLGSEEVARVMAQPEWRCTLRNVLWQEGLSGRHRAALRENLGVDVAKDTVLCELDAGMEVPVWGLIALLFCTAAFASGLFLVAKRMQRA